MPRLKVAALLAGEPGPQELWTLRAISTVDCELYVVQAERAGLASKWRRLWPLIREHGLAGTLSRLAGAVIAGRVAARDRAFLDELFDIDDLRAWWKAGGIAPTRVSALNEARAVQALSAIGPDLIVRVSGGVLKPQVLALARVAALNIHHGKAPSIRGMWSIPWGIVEGRADWIGATVHLMDAGIDTGPILWRGGPQLAPGDNSVELLFRAHLEAVKALTELLKEYARGGRPTPWTLSPGETSTYRSAAGLRGWIRFLRLRRGRRARVLIERGLEC